MTDTLTAALAWAERGFRVFPLVPGSKKPMNEGWPDMATADAGEINALWRDPVTGWPQDYNVGVLTNDMIVVDVDDKNGKNGTASLLELDLPLDTLVVRTPTGGRHVYYTGPNKSLSVGKLGAGLDIRSYHGYVLAPGSRVPEGVYTLDNDAPLLPAPEDLIRRLDEPRERQRANAAVELDKPSAIARAADFLEHEAPLALEGAGGDHTTFKVACTLKDYGLSKATALALLIEMWNPRCAPPWDHDELEQKVENAYTYGTVAPGALSPEADFAGIRISPPPRAGRRQWFRHGDDYAPPNWLFHEIIPEKGVGMLIAPSSSGKTFLTVHLAAALAKGEPFFGVSPSAPGGTALLLAEGAGGARGRINAVKAVGRLPIAATDVGIINGKLQALAEDLNELSATMVEDYGTPLRLVILDTLSASGLLKDENDNAEAAIAMKALSKLSEMTGAFMLVVHHPPKGGKGERGAGSLRNSADVAFEIYREGKSPIRRLEIEKSRDGPVGPIGDFTLVPVEIGRDAQGRKIETCVVSTAPATRVTEEQPRYTDLFMECMDWGLDSEEGETIEGRRAIELEAVKAIFTERKDGSRDRSNIARAWKAVLAYVLDTGAVREVAFGGRRYLTKLAL